MRDISLIMPVFNPPEDGLGRMLASIARQSGVDFELVAVNDGSTDRTGDILRAWQASHPGRMTIIERENRGLGLSRNEAFLAATGRYVWFVDGDDEIRPDCLREIVATMDATGAEQLLLNFDVTASGIHAPFPERPDDGVRAVPKSFVFAYGFRTAWKRVLRRDFLSRIGVSFCDARTQEDLPETARWTLETDRLFYSDKVRYRYFIHPDSSCHRVLDSGTLASTLQIYDAFRSLADRYPAYRDWMVYSAQFAANESMAQCSIALEHLRRSGESATEEIERLERLRETFRGIVDCTPEDRPLFALFNRGRRKALDETEPKIRSLVSSEQAAWSEAAENARKARKLEADVRELRRRVERAEKRLAAVQSSLSWRITAPLRAVLAPFARAHKRTDPS